MNLSLLDYDLPASLVAQTPASRRDRSRLMVVDRSSGAIAHTTFSRIGRFLKRGDLLVMNDTRVIPARLMGRRASGGKVEVFLLERLPGLAGGRESYRALIRPLGRLNTGEEISFGAGVAGRLEDPKAKIVSFAAGGASRAMALAGRLPLPPYIKRDPTPQDEVRYQTVVAKCPGAVAAPTAGLHFTKGLLARLGVAGVRQATLTLHVNYATFAPVRALDPKDHKMDPEYFSIPRATCRAVRATRERGGRVIAVGTTVTKTLEDRAGVLLGGDKSEPLSGASTLFIHPPFCFRVADVLLTNFHLPRTTLLWLVAAFAGPGLIRRAYEEAVRERYRFYSYGDAMLIL